MTPKSRKRASNRATESPTTRKAPAPAAPKPVAKPVRPPAPDAKSTPPPAKVPAAAPTAKVTQPRPVAKPAAASPKAELRTPAKAAPAAKAPTTAAPIRRLPSKTAPPEVKPPAPVKAATVAAAATKMVKKKVAGTPKSVPQRPASPAPTPVLKAKEVAPATVGPAKKGKTSSTPPALPRRTAPPAPQPVIAPPAVATTKPSAATPPPVVTSLPKTPVASKKVVPSPAAAAKATPTPAPKPSAPQPTVSPEAKATPKKKSVAANSSRPELVAGKAKPPVPAAVVNPPSAAAITPKTSASPPKPSPPPPAAKISDELARRLPLLFDRPPATAAVPSRLPTIPAILLEGDRPGTPTREKPGAATPGITGGPVATGRFVPPLPDGAGASPVNVRADPVRPEPATSATPDSNPTEVPFPASGSLWLTARDPFCVCAHWQVPVPELNAYARAHPGGTWRLRVHLDSVAGPLIQEQPFAEADHRFVPVFQPGARYVAELGYRFADGGWRGLALSSPTITPPDSPAPRFDAAEIHRAPAGPVTPDLIAQLPPDHPEPVPAPRYSARLPDIAPPAVLGTDAPPLKPTKTRLPSTRQAQWLTELVWEPVVRPAGAPSSAEVADWQAREVSRATGDLAAAGTSAASPSSGELAAPGVGLATENLPASEAVPVSPAPPPGFWFKVNAELIIYGSTERDAKVTIAGRPVALRADGSFSFRFALPDGNFTLPAIAVNSAGTDGRSAQLRFTRATVLTGEVGVHPQDTRLKPPIAEAIG